MSIVKLAILSPQHGATFVDAPRVRLRGGVLSSGHPPLFFTWYSSLNTPPPDAPTDVALKDSGGGAPADPLDFETVLRVGSHVLTLAAKDVPGDTLADIAAVQDAGMAGGPEAAEQPCIVHVLIATMVEPAADGETLSRAGSTLAAEAPVHWDADDYQAVNQVRYRWRFEPAPPVDGRPPVTLAPAAGELAFDATVTPPLVRCPLPGDLAPGNYTLVLRVESAADAAQGHEAARQVHVAA